MYGNNICPGVTCLQQESIVHYEMCCRRSRKCKQKCSEGTSELCKKSIFNSIFQSMFTLKCSTMKYEIYEVICIWFIEIRGSNRHSKNSFGNRYAKMCLFYCMPFQNEIFAVNIETPNWNCLVLLTIWQFQYNAVGAQHYSGCYGSEGCERARVSWNRTDNSSFELLRTTKHNNNN